MEIVKPSFIIEDDRFDVSELADKELILEFQRSKFVFIVKCQKSNEIQWLEEYSLDLNLEVLKLIFNQHRFLKANFWNAIKVVYHPIKKAIVPDTYFQNSNPVDLLPEGVNPKEAIEIRSFKISPTLHLIYQIETNILNFLTDVYIDKKLHIIAMDRCLINTPNCLIMHFEKENITLQKVENSYIEQSRILNFKNFEIFKSLIETLGLNMEEDLVLTGEITTYSKYYHHLSSSFKRVSFGKPIGNLRLSQYFSEVPKHKYLTIFNGSIVS